MTPTLLVANRGEIACRVMRTARRLGWRTVAVYSEADANAPHVAAADAALCIGAAPSSASYLNIPGLLGAARRSGATAVHPGYGFLSERADFAQAVLDAGLVWVGPPPAAIGAMGDKAAAKRAMAAAGVPIAPGYLGEQQDEATLHEQARALGLPLLVKAVAGGGGRGIRVLRRWDELDEALAGARREAERAFGDGTLMLERLVDDARHVEVQVFCDAHGGALHLGERDCTAQRRRQKLIEETPSPILDARQRAALCADAVAAARAVGYVGAGTVEFVVDAAGQHFFLEMNTRLQVEHPVTECVTGLDLVEWQLRVALGEPLPLAQQQIRFEGHAIEARLVAEDPYAGWVPQTGRIAGWRPQDAGQRVDHGIAQGGELTPHYDGLVAKFIAHGRDRADAIRRLRRALADAPLLGLANNAHFLRRLLDHPDFRDAKLTTTRLDDWQATGAAPLQRPAVPEAAWRLAAAVLGDAAAAPTRGLRPLPRELPLRCGDEQRTLRLPDPGARVLTLDEGWLQADLDGQRQRWPARLETRHGAAPRLHLGLDGLALCLEAASPWPRAAAAGDPRRVSAPVAGTVAALTVAVGDAVAAGAPLVCVEAMKMEQWQQAGMAGRVAAVHVAPGQVVAAGALLIELEPSPAPA